MGSINPAKLLRGLFLIEPRRRTLRQRFIEKIVEARELPKTVLAPEFIETRNAMFAVADDVESRDIDLLRRAVQTRQLNILHKLGNVVQSKQTKPLAPKA